MSYELHTVGLDKNERASNLSQRPSDSSVSPVPTKHEQSSTRDVKVVPFRDLFAFTKWQHAGALTMALLASAINAALKTTLAVILGRIFDLVASFGSGENDGGFTLREISKWCLIITGLGIGQWLSNTLFLSFWTYFGELQAESVRRTMFARLLGKDMAWFDTLEQGVSSLLVRTQTQTRELQAGTSQVFGHLVCESITSLASLGIAFYFSWKLTLVLLATLPVSFIILWLASKSLEPAIQAQKDILAVASKHLTSSITAIDLVKVFNGHDQGVYHYSNLVKLAATQYLIQARCSAIQQGYTSFWVINLFVVGFYYGIVLVNHGLNPGVVITTFYATLTSFQGIEALLPHWLVIIKGVSAGSFLSGLMKEDESASKTNYEKTHINPDRCFGAIELSNVEFAYPSTPSKTVLRNSSISFPAGETTFIVGRSGSGKSTIGNLVSNLYEPTTGYISIDGHPLRMLDKDWIKANVTLIQQTSTLFHDTFFGNVSLGHTDPSKATRAEVKAACEAVLLQSALTALPHGLDTKLGPGGHNLSGGQKQRLALARARLKDPPVLILDEVTSGLDQITRLMIMEMIREWRCNKTTIIITHDASQILDDDFVYVIEDSQVVEKGLKHNLLEHGNSYLASIILNAAKTCPSAASEATSAPDSPLTNISLGNSELWTNRESQLLPDWSMRLSVGNGLLLASLVAPSPIDQTEAPSRVRRKHASRVMVPKQSPKLQLDIEDAIEYEKRRFSKFVRDKFSLTDFEVSQHSMMLNTGSSSSLKATETWESRSESETLVDVRSRSGANAVSMDSKRCPSQAHQQPSRLPDIRRGSKLLKTRRLDKGSLRATIRTVWPSLNISNRIALILGLLICLIGAATTPAFAYCFARLLSVFWSYGDKAAEGRKWAIALVGIATIDGIATGASRYLIEMAAQAWVDIIRVKALEKILKQSKTWFDESEHSPGRINECLDRNSEETRNIVGRFIPIVVHVVAILTISVIWALVVSWKLTLVSLAPIPIILAAIKGYSYVSGIWERQCNNSAEEASAVLTDIFSNIRVVKSLALETHFGNKYLKLVSDTLGVGFKRALYPSGLYGLYQSTNYAVVALVFYYGTALMVKDKRITASGMMQVVNLLLFGIGTSSSILSHIPQLTMAQAAATALLRFADLPSSPPTECLGRHPLSSPLPLRLHKVSFSYPQEPRKSVLRDVSFDVKAGQCVAVVGHSGCGKSTIVSLLLGLYPPHRSLGGSPSLSFSGFSYTDIDISALRSMMAYVPQAPFLFPGTIADNIAYGLPDSSPYRNAEEISRAAQDAGVHDFIISLPDGYNTLVGEGGQAISGGQAQRVNIARALVRQPKLLILDEPTSALDPHSAEMVRATLLELTHQPKDKKNGMAIVLVTHSREMMQMADEVVVLEDGRSVETGSYSGLLHADGALAELLGVRRRQDEKEGTWVEEQDIPEGNFF